MRGRFQVTTPLRASSISASLPLGQRRADAAPHPNPLPVKYGERGPRRDLLTRVPSPSTPLHPPPSSRRRPGPTTRLTWRDESESRSPLDTSSSSRTRAETCVYPRLRGDDVLRRMTITSSDRSQVNSKRSRVSAPRERHRLCAQRCCRPAPLPHSPWQGLTLPSRGRAFDVSPRTPGWPPQGRPWREGRRLRPHRDHMTALAERASRPFSPRAGRRLG